MYQSGENLNVNFLSKNFQGKWKIPRKQILGPFFQNFLNKIMFSSFEMKITNILHSEILNKGVTVYSPYFDMSRDHRDRERLRRGTMKNEYSIEN